MALFKQFHGTEEELNKTTSIIEGRNYFLTTNGKMFIDTANERICLNAEEADVAAGLKVDNDTTIAANKVVTKDDTIGIGNGGTGAKTLTEARSGLQIDRAVAFTIVLAAADWVVDGNVFKQNKNLEIKCGSAGNVPPVISPAEGTLAANFALLDSIEADIANKVLTIVARQRPSVDLTISVIDHQ